MIRKLVWAVLSAFVLGALIAFAISLLRRPASTAASGYQAPESHEGPTAA
jgi:hypothetical protein